MIELYMWCQLMTANGPETIKVKAALTNELVCGRFICSEGVRILRPGEENYELIKLNMCFFKNPKENK